MANVEHEEIAAANRHALNRWVWANEAARLAQAVTADDIHKLGYQTSDGTYWYLASTSPSVWVTSSDAKSLLGAPLDTTVGAADPGDFLIFDGTEWKATKTHVVDAVGDGYSLGLLLQNTTASTLLQGQASPILAFAGGWGSGATMLGVLQLRHDGPVISGSSDDSRELQFIYTEDLVTINKLFGLATNGVTQRLTVYGATRGEVAFESGGSLVSTTTELTVSAPSLAFDVDSGGFYQLKYDGGNGWVLGSLFGTPGLIVYPEFDAGAGTDFYIATNDPAGSRAGMNFRFVAGAGGPGGDNAGGGFFWFAGDAVGSANGGGFSWTGGAGGDASGNGGGFSFTCGSENGGGNGGSITGIAGTSYSATPGHILWVGGEGAPAGNATLQGGPSASGGAGKARLLGGDGTVGGDVDVTAGASTGAFTAKVNITGGSGLNAGGVVVSGGTPSDGSGAGVDLVGTAGFGTDKVGGSITGIGGNSTGTADPGSLAFVAGNATDSNDGGVAGFGGGNGDGFGAGGGATLFAGDGGPSGGPGGPALVRGGDAGAAGVAGGEARVRGGSGNSTNSPGGPAIVQGGPAGSTGPGGDASLLGGIPTDGDGADVNVIASDGVSSGTNRDGGQATLGAGDAALAGTGGSLFATAGGGGDTGTPGVAHLQGGAGGLTSGPGGNAMVEGGIPPTHGDGGSVLLNGAPAASTGGGKVGGSVIAQPGTQAGGGLDGSILLKDASGAVVLEIDSVGLGFFAATPIAQPNAYTVTNPTDRRSYDTTTITLPQLAEVVGTIIADLQSYGLFQ